MKQIVTFFLFLSIALIGNTQQDTVIIKSIKQYQEGKVNLLRTPKGKTTVVKLVDNSTWKEKTDEDSVLYWDKEKKKA
jgi:hypothetical protein